MALHAVGLVGLGVMGENLALNIEEHGFPIAVYNRTWETTQKFVAANSGKKIEGFKTPQEFVAALATPRKIILLVKAGAPVDATIAALRPHLAPGDLVIDGGNEFFQNTERRGKELASDKIRYVGMGVSGGEEGARRGPSLMPGGEASIWPELAPILTKIAAQVDDGPCVDYMGPGGAGHYVKMVHNGIEYGDMQLIAEAYDVLKTLGGFTNPELSDIFASWNDGELQSFLVEITAKVLRKKDDRDPSRFLVDVIRDAAGSKGTGKWTVEQAAELAAPVPTIASALDARYLSAMKAERTDAAKTLPGPPAPRHPDPKHLADDVKHALYAAKIGSYAQGMHLLQAASKQYGWNLQLGKIARIWKGGCIIRARFLGRITAAYARNPELPNLMLDGEFAHEIGERQAAWRRVVANAVTAGIPLPATGAALAYLDSYRRERLPANLIQAQRDFFGAHTFERLDDAVGKFFHADWSDVA